MYIHYWNEKLSHMYSIYSFKYMTAKL